MSARVFTIPSRTPFVDALAAGILERYGGTPDALGAVMVLLPTRRACRALAEAFLRAAGGVLLLPTMRPIGDVEEDALALAALGAYWEGDAAQVLALPPALSPLRRQVLLAQLILRKEFQQGREAPAPDQALFLAAELGRLLDLMQTEGVEFEALESVVPENLAFHWQETLDFLQLVTKHWPKVLAEEGALDPANRRNRLMKAQAEHWRSDPPTDPIIAAGSTGTVPATAELMAVIAGLPQGAVILPGLDVAMPPDAWDAIDPGHPQAAMKQLLGHLGVDRGDLRAWGDGTVSGAPSERTTLISEALRPAAAWEAPEGSVATNSGDPQVIPGLHHMECAGPEEEARAIALVLREALETPERTAALVTPDRDLARRVAVELTRWGLKIDDSAGAPLGQTPVGSFLRLTAEMLAEHVAPVPLLAACKHPLAAGGMAAGAFRNQARRLEELVLRGPRPAPGFDGLIAAVKAEGADDLADWLAPIAQASRDLSGEMQKDKADLGAMVRSHLQFAEFLAADKTQSGDLRLWAKDDGEAAALWIAEVLAAAPSAPAIQGDHYPLVLDALMSGVVVRPTFGRHPRLHIWGTLEARLQHADVLILGGLNEGTWPGEPKADPWLSRPMRADAGLPMPEQRIGLSAHDFVQAASAPVAVLTRATKVAGHPTVPSRWLERLRAVLTGRELTFAPSPWLGWQTELDRPAAVKPLGPPAPKPPVSARPRKLSATRIETWVRDPYGIYAQYVLRLRALDPLDDDPGAAERGIILHQALDEFVHAFPKELPPDALERLIDMGKLAFGENLERPGVRAFWWPRFERVAQWFVAHERRRRLEATVVGSESPGQLEIPAPGGPFIVTAIADRIERLADGNLVVVDYKTGSAPQNQDLKQGFSPQLPIEAVLAEAGGFEGVAGGPVSQLAVWRVSGAGDGGDVQAYKKLDVPETVEQTRAGLARLIAAFDDPNMPYRSRPRPDHQPRFSDYDHLARVKEWSAGGGGE